MKRVLTFFIFLFLISGPVEAAASVVVEARGPINPIKLDSDFVVAVVVSSREEAFNALAGTVAYPADVLELTEVSDGGSIINFWLDRVDPVSDALHFSGIVPGGYYGEFGQVLRLRFRASQEGTGVVSVNDVQALRNDGTGTALETTVTPLSFSVSVDGEVAPDVTADNTPPEEFPLTIAQDSTLFDNAPFLVFSTTDKESGMDRYEVSIDGQPYERIESPYRLPSSQVRHIVVRAYDRAGNFRESVWRQDESAGYARPSTRAILFAVLLFSIAILLGIVGRRYRRQDA